MGVVYSCKCMYDFQCAKVQCQTLFYTYFSFYVTRVLQKGLRENASIFIPRTLSTSLLPPFRLSLLLISLYSYETLLFKI